MPVRYYFNLTDGELVIRDEDGVEVPDIQAAVIYAMEVIEELRAEDPSNSETWAGWRLEIVDTQGRMVQCVELDKSSVQ